MAELDEEIERVQQNRRDATLDEDHKEGLRPKEKGNGESNYNSSPR